MPEKCNQRNHYICCGRVVRIEQSDSPRAERAEAPYRCERCGMGHAFPIDSCDYEICGTCIKAWYPRGPCKCDHDG